jgi:hypothetical protein
METLKEIAEQCLQRQPTYIEAEFYRKLFQLPESSLYEFPSLEVDEYGFFTGQFRQCGRYDTFRKEDLSICYEDVSYDTQLEKEMLENDIDFVEIDLDKSTPGYPYFDSHDCSIYPEKMKDLPSVYDTLYICDYYLKHIYGILLKLLVLGRSEEQIMFSQFLISYQNRDGKYCVSSIHERREFRMLFESIQRFISHNSMDMEEIRKSYESCRGNTSPIRINLNYSKIYFSSDTESETIHFEPLQPNVTIRYGDQEEIPYYLTFVKRYLEEHYEDITSAFSIYHRLENIFRLSALVNLRRQGEIKTCSFEIPTYTLCFTRKFADRIMCCGGIKAPTKCVRTLPKPQKPITNKVIEICGIKRGLADAPIYVGSLHHAGIMIKTCTDEYHIVEYGPSGGVLRKINPNISGLTMNEEGHTWTIDSCEGLRSNEYDPERIKTLMDIITYGQNYDLIAHNCQDIKRKILDALRN